MNSTAPAYDYDDTIAAPRLSLVPNVQATIPAPPPEDLMTFDRAIEKARPLVRSIAKRFAGSESFDDLMQEGFVGVMQAAATWHPDRGASFRTWAFRWIWGAIHDASQRARLRGLTRQGGKASLRQSVMRLTSFDASYEDDETLHDVIGEEAMQEETIAIMRARVALASALPSLSEEHSAVVEATCAGLIPREIVEEISMSRTRVYHHLDRVIMAASTLYEASKAMT
jgi:RNA polymerase sigma factor (sigma-70 family)